MQRVKVAAIHQPQVTPQDAKYASCVTWYAYSLIDVAAIVRWSDEHIRSPLKHRPANVCSV